MRKQLIGYGVVGALVLAAVAIGALLLASGDDQGGGELYPEGKSIPAPGELSVDLTAAAKTAGCELKSKPAPSRAIPHLEDPAAKQDYNLNPPAAGPHYDPPAPDGVYDDPPPKEHLVHTQEHGRVVIWFKRGIAADARGQLKTLVDEDPTQLVLTPYDELRMPYQVAATAWGREPVDDGTGYLMGCPAYAANVIDALRAFIGEHRGNGPEAIP